MDETRPEKMSVMLNDSQMYCRRNMRRLDLVSKLTTAQPSSIQRAKRNLLKSFESSNNSLTAASGAALNSIKSYEILEKANSISFNRIMTNISQTMKHKWYSLYWYRSVVLKVGHSHPLRGIFDIQGVVNKPHGHNFDH